MSLLGHHSKEQTAYYNFTGEIYNEEYAMYVELPPALNIEIPSHFLILHSLFIGLNTYYNLPNFGLNPYLGFGLGALFNSVQSQYPGPANLVQEEGKLALDELSWDFGYHGIIGFRHQQPDSFYYFEIRPMFHQFNYESGEGLLKEFDSFTKQMNTPWGEASIEYSMTSHYPASSWPSNDKYKVEDYGFLSVTSNARHPGDSYNPESFRTLELSEDKSSITRITGKGTLNSHIYIGLCGVKDYKNCEDVIGCKWLWSHDKCVPQTCPDMIQNDLICDSKLCSWNPRCDNPNICGPAGDPPRGFRGIGTRRKV